MNCLTLGAIDYLVKPLRHNELRHIWTRVWWWRRVRIKRLQDRFDAPVMHLSNANKLCLPVVERIEQPSERCSHIETSSSCSNIWSDGQHLFQSKLYREQRDCMVSIKEHTVNIPHLSHNLVYVTALTHNYQLQWSVYAKSQWKNNTQHRGFSKHGCCKSMLPLCKCR